MALTARTRGRLVVGMTLAALWVLLASYLVWQHGNVVEEGSHSELLTRRGVYARLYELQYRGQDISAAQ